MNKVVAIGGVPGTGKTTLVQRVISFADDWEVCKPAELLDAIYSESLDLYILGKYAPFYEGDGYAWGTDRLSMAVQPKASEFLKETNSNILFEGDRLFNQSFLELCVDKTTTLILVLKAERETLKCRYEERGSEQSEKFIQGRETKYGNLLTNFVLMPYTEYVENTNLDDQEKIVSQIRKFLDDRTN
jgi:deoxyadenosine/deoxycytidine kinase